MLRASVRDTVAGDASGAVTRLPWMATSNLDPPPFPAPSCIVDEMSFAHPPTASAKSRTDGRPSLDDDHEETYPVPRASAVTTALSKSRFRRASGIPVPVSRTANLRHVASVLLFRHSPWNTTATEPR